MNRRKDVIAVLQHELPRLKERFGVASLMLFGSVARGDDTPSSDVDLLVEFDRAVSLFTLYHVKHSLMDALGCQVDIGTLASLKPQLRDQVLSESVRVA